MLDANIPWLSKGFKRFERDNFFHNDVRNQNHQSTNSINRQRTQQQIRRVKSATQRRATTPVNFFNSSSRPKSAQSCSNKTQKHEKDSYYNYRTDSQNSRTPLRHRRSHSARLASRSSDPENIRNSPVYKKYYEELEKLESMNKDDCSYCPVDCRPVSSSSYRPTSSTGLLATLLPSHFERYAFWTRPCTAPPTKREYFQLPRHNNIRRGHVPHYTNFVSSINLSERDSTPSPPLHPRRAFEDVSQSKRDVRRSMQRNVRPVDKSHNIKNEYVITVENDDDKTDTDVELLKLVEDDVVVDDFTPDLIEGPFDQSVEPHAPTPTPLASPPPQDEEQKEVVSTSSVLETKTQQLPQEEEPTTVPTETEEQSEQSSPASPVPASSLLEEELKEPVEEESASVERVPTPPQSKKEVKFQEPLVEEHPFEDHEATEGTTRSESEISLNKEENEEKYDSANEGKYDNTNEEKYDNANEDVNEKLEEEAPQIEAEKQGDKEETQDEVSKSIDSGVEPANSENQTDPKEDSSQKRRVLGPPPKYKVDIFGLDSQSFKDLLDIEMRMRRRGTEPSPDIPDITDVSDVDIKKPKMQSWLRGRLALSRQSSRFEIPMDVRVLEKMTPMDYLVGYCRINKRRQALYKKAFRRVDKDNDGVINIKEMEKALGEIFVDSIETEQIQTLLELIQIDQTVRLRSKMFCVIAALTERLLYQQLTTKEAAELMNHKKERIEDADFSALDWKLEGCNIQPELRKLLFQL